MDDVNEDGGTTFIENETEVEIEAVRKQSYEEGFSVATNIFKGVTDEISGMGFDDEQVAWFIIGFLHYFEKVSGSVVTEPQDENETIQ